MNKFNILNSIISTASASFEGAVTAADEARATATNKENVAENKYDTLGLEAAYLAHGQSKRGLQLEQDLAAFVSLTENLTEHSEARLGSLVEVEQPDGEVRYLFIGPGCGGLKIDGEGETVTVIFHGVFSPNSKLREYVVRQKQVEEQENPKPKAYSMTWAQRLKRVFSIDIEKCEKCGGPAGAPARSNHRID